MTNQKKTFDILDSYFLDTVTMQLNIDHLRDSVFWEFDIVQRNINAGNGKSLLTVNLENSRRSISSLVQEAFIEMVNSYFEYEFGTKTIHCTSSQLKKYLAQYGYTMESAFCPVMKELKKMRNDLQVGKDK